MKLFIRRLHVCVLFAFAASCASARDTRFDSELASYINSIKAIDVHAHPLKYVVEGAPADSEYDALPLDGIPPFAVPYRLRPDNPQYRDAQRALYGVNIPDSGIALERALKKARSDKMKERGEHFAEWVLDQTNTEVMLANRIAMGAGLPPSRFKWIPFVDALMLPLDTRNEAARTPDTRQLYPLEDKLLRRYLADLKLKKIPATLELFETQVVAPTLERQKAAGAIGIKFEAAYLRSLDFEEADAASARVVYAKYAEGGAPTHAEYTLLQDFLFRVIARHAGTLALTVQIHSAEGFGGFYSPEGAAPHQLESVFNDSTLRATNFVIVHGGWPRVDETMSLLSKPNVYTDISMMDILAESNALALTLRKWLNDSPEKVLFGTDAFDGGDMQGWEQVAWVASHNARTALTEALSGMLRDGEVTRERAHELARMVLRENALNAYHLAPTQQE
ncbi:MAG: amidohydrolase family protein [Gemmatimonadaceae bacterium]